MNQLLPRCDTEPRTGAPSPVCSTRTRWWRAGQRTSSLFSPFRAGRTSWTRDAASFVLLLLGHAHACGAAESTQLLLEGVAVRAPTPSLSLPSPPSRRRSLLPPAAPPAPAPAPIVDKRRGETDRRKPPEEDRIRGARLPGQSPSPSCLPSFPRQPRKETRTAAGRGFHPFLEDRVSHNGLLCPSHIAWSQTLAVVTLRGRPLASLPV